MCCQYSIACLRRDLLGCFYEQCVSVLCQQDHNAEPDIWSNFLGRHRNEKRVKRKVKLPATRPTWQGPQGVTKVTRSARNEHTERPK